MMVIGHNDLLYLTDLTARRNIEWHVHKQKAVDTPTPTIQAC